VPLPADFGERHRRAAEDAGIAASRRTRSENRIAALLREIGGLSVPDALIEHGETIGDLFQEAGSIRKAAADRLHLEGLLDGTRIDACERLRSLGRDIPIEEAHILRVEKPAAIRIEELSREYERREAFEAGIGREIDKLTLRTGRLQEELTALPPSIDLGDLKQVISETAAAGDLEARYLSLQAQAKRSETELDAALSRLSLWSGTAASLARLPLPSMETVDAFETRLKTGEDRLATHQAEAASFAGRLGEIEAELRQITLVGDIPTEAALAAARNLRDETWQSLQASWASGRPPSRDAASRYETLVRDVDALSDRLRREAGRVAAKAALDAEHERLSKRHRSAEKAIAAARIALAKDGETWTEHWKAATIIPLSPREMRSWLHRHAELVRQTAAFRDQTAMLETLDREIRQCRKALARHLNIPTDTVSLSGLVRHARKAVEQNERLETRRAQLAADLAQRMEELRDARRRAAHAAEEKTAWRSRWEKALRPIRLDADATPAQAVGLLAELNVLFEKIREAEILAKRIRSIDRDAENFAARVRDFVAAQAPDLTGREAAAAVRELHARLTQALKTKTTKEGLEKQLAQERASLQDAADEIHRIAAHLDTLCREAGCGTPAELRTAERRSEKRRRIEAELERIEEHLRSLSAGQTLATFIADAATVDPDTIDLQIARLTETMRRLDHEKSDIDQAIGSHRTELAKMDGGHLAADLAEQGQQTIAAIRSDVERFLRLKMAAVLLNRAMERYREKNQGPIIRRATDLFARMTLGSFEGLRLEFDDKNDAVLVGVRAGGKEVVHVSGMSDGTADQLYLAIRLASLETYLSTNEPLPFIVDDILVQFDDRRAGASLEALLELAGSTQVIFFTHHRHLVDLARSRLNGALDIHTLVPRYAGDTLK